MTFNDSKIHFKTKNKFTTFKLYLDEIKRRSAGKKAPALTRTTSPTFICCHVSQSHWPSLRTSTCLLLVSWSALCLFCCFRNLADERTTTNGTNWIKKRDRKKPPMKKLLLQMCIGCTVYAQYTTYDIFDNFLGGWHGQNEQQWNKRRVSTCRWHIRNLLPYDDDAKNTKEKTNIEENEKNHTIR